MKKILALVLALTTIFALAIPAMAADNVFDFDVNNANFHCNDIEGENGRVWPVLTALGLTDGKANNGNNKNKLTITLRVNRVGTSTTWKLAAANKDGIAQNNIKCPACGRTDWITFSNNSGVPNGNNVQFQHDGPSRRWITIKVTYHLDIPACKVFTCKNANTVCKFVCTCEGCTPVCNCPNPCNLVCKYAVQYPTHACTFKCGKGHDCPIKGATCAYDCKHEFHASEVVVNMKVPIKIADGYLFVHTVNNIWTKDGKTGYYVSGDMPIGVYSKRLYNNAQYDIYYKGCGKCKCDCPPVTCNAACVRCSWTPPAHVHVPICENCKDGQGNNHNNCESKNPENTTNYYCLNCPDNKNKDLKLGAYHANAWDIIVASWTPGPYPGTCKCTHK